MEFSKKMKNDMRNKIVKCLMSTDKFYYKNFDKYVNVKSSELLILKKTSKFKSRLFLLHFHANFITTSLVDSESLHPLIQNKNAPSKYMNGDLVISFCDQSFTKDSASPN